MSLRRHDANLIVSIALHRTAYRPPPYRSTTNQQHATDQQTAVPKAAKKAGATSEPQNEHDKHWQPKHHENPIT